MNAREHLAAVVKAVIKHPSTPATAEVIHAAANFLQVPEGPFPGMSPTQFQQEVCMNMVKAASSQHLDVTKVKGVKLQRFYIEHMRGAANALTVLHSDQANGLLWLFVMVCTRGAEVVHCVAEGKSIS